MPSPMEPLSLLVLLGVIVIFYCIALSMLIPVTAIKSHVSGLQSVTYKGQEGLLTLMHNCRTYSEGD